MSESLHYRPRDPEQKSRVPGGELRKRLLRHSSQRGVPIGDDSCSPTYSLEQADLPDDFAPTDSANHRRVLLIVIAEDQQPAGDDEVDGIRLITGTEEYVTCGEPNGLDGSRNSTDQFLVGDTSDCCEQLGDRSGDERRKRFRFAL
jgi:hypothetical protein